MIGRWVLALLALMLAALLALAAWGYAEATRDPVVVRYSIGLANWPAATPPLRIVQLSDIHAGWPDMPVEREARIVAQVNALRPDIIVLTGDYTGGKLWDRDVGTFDALILPLRGLRARYGVYAVRGNHDGLYWTPIVFGRTPIKLLTNRWVEAGPIILAGVDDITGPTQPNLSELRSIAGAPAGRPLVMLSHEPDFLIWLPRRVDLLIAGHTHGGQIKLPLLGWRSMNDFLDTHRRGLYREGGHTLLVSSGIGTSLVPLRIGVPPEIVEITLGRAAHSVGRNSGTDK